MPCIRQSPSCRPNIIEAIWNQNDTRGYTLNFREVLFSFNRTRSSGDGGGLYAVYAEIQQITGKWGKAKPNNLPFLDEILKSVVVQRNQPCSVPSDSKEIKNQI